MPEESRVDEDSVTPNEAAAPAHGFAMLGEQGAVCRDGVCEIPTAAVDEPGARRAVRGFDG